MNNSTINSMPERIIFKNLVDRYGKAISQTDSQPIIDFIEENTNIVDGLVAEPKPDDPIFHSRPMHSFQDEKELAEIVKEIISTKQGSCPDNLYVLSEEHTPNQTNLAEFPIDHFLKQVVPYIHERGVGNYFATDSEQTTVTFYHEGILYWKKLL